MEEVCQGLRPKRTRGQYFTLRWEMKPVLSPGTESREKIPWENMNTFEATRPDFF
jgi:hypothetical protein